MRILMIITIFGSVFFTGCSSPNWEASIQPPAKFIADQPIPLLVEIEENGKPVTGLQVKGELEMAKMDHGTVIVNFKEIDNGKYEGSVELPMNGKWNAIIEMKKGKISKEQTVTYEVE